jgi:AbrB family looped-hinge helix DNA binding protein
MPSTAARPGSTSPRGAAQPALDEASINEATVQLRDRGVVTLPKALRDRYGLSPGDALRVVDLDGVFVVTPLVPMVPELAREIERLRTEAGLSTEDLLDGLRRERERYARERYGIGADDASDEDTAGTNG